MKVTLIASTQTHTDALSQWYETEGASGEEVCVFAGRSCYQSFGKPNPKTATNAGYLAHILKVAHLSVLEHASATFYIEGVSRSLTHELVRHRHLSYSQLSQRFVDESNTDFVDPPLICRDEYASGIFDSAMDEASERYSALVEQLTKACPDATRKQIREAARAVLPNATETKIVVTGNYRAWRHFIDLRATAGADAEIRALAVEILAQLAQVAPNVFGEYEMDILDDASVVAASPSREVS